ncbi:MAG: hypothetical protein ACYDAL_15345 [Candidatus Dormibacteraceae bacterium]
MPHTYLAQVERSGGPGGSVLHLIREDAEASLCAIPRSSLTGGGRLDQVVCAACLEWFEKRRKISGEHKVIEVDS